MNYKSLLLNSFIFFLILTNNSYAYLDPGSGSFLLQIVALVASFFLVLWNKIKIIITSIILKIKSIYQLFKKKFFKT
ncbi:hypothetical protein [Candidatus Pelagibacter sp. HIMB1748]|uniref:hypothetical protein n=1 Tax=unclassified Candidatus Pelagibacter TaxID=2647897 RepID=UPI003F8514ED